MRHTSSAHLLSLFAISCLFSPEVFSQTANIKILMARVDSVFAVSDGHFLRTRRDTVWFGVHANGSNCSDTNLTGFATNWFPGDTTPVTEFEQPPPSPAGDFRLGKPKNTAPFACYPQNGLQFDIRHFSDTTQRDTFKVLATQDLSDPAETHRYMFSWPTTLGSYYDSCVFIGPIYSSPAPLTFVDMIRRSKYLLPTDPDTGGQITFSILTIGPKQQPATSVEPGVSPSPVQFGLSQNYPNPFNPETHVRFRVKSSGIVSVKVYDILGREAAVLVNGEKPPGEYSVTWDGRLTGGRAAPSGVYYCVITSGQFTDVKKMILLR